MCFWLRLAAIAAGALFCVPMHYLWKAAGARSIWPQIFLGYAGRCCGMRVRIEGMPLGHKVLFAANHVSWLDVLALGGAAPAIFVARDDLAGWRLLGWLADFNDTLYVARHRRSQVHGQADRIRSALADGRAVALFAEGTTEGAAEVLPFRASLFASLFPPLDGVKVQPLAIDYGAAAGDVAWTGSEGVGTNARKVLSRRRSFEAVLRFLAPIDPAAAGDRKRLAAHAREEVVQALGASAAAGDPL